jgi:carboxymethylenebutenolidase
MRSLHSVLAAITIGVSSLALAADAPKLPPAEAGAKERIEKTPRHAEYVDITLAGGKPIKSYVVYPEVKEKAPVVIVIHEIFGLSDWVKSVADQLAADGFIAIAPDMLSGMGEGGKGTEGFKDRQGVMAAIKGLKPEQVVAQLNAVRDYGKKIPASNGKTATIGFCWGGGQSFAYAVAQPELQAAVVYYGPNPDPAVLDKVKAPVMGNYGGDDARVGKTVPPAQEAMKKAGKTYEVHTYEGAGHGFLRQQDERPANDKAAKEAWPATIKFLRENTK